MGVKTSTVSVIREELQETTSVSINPMFIISLDHIFGYFFSTLSLLAVTFVVC